MAAPSFGGSCSVDPAGAATADLDSFRRQYGMKNIEFGPHASGLPSATRTDSVSEAHVRSPISSPTFSPSSYAAHRPSDYEFGYADDYDQPPPAPPSDPNQFSHDGSRLYNHPHNHNHQRLQLQLHQQNRRQYDDFSDLPSPLPPLPISPCWDSGSFSDGPAAHASSGNHTPRGIPAVLRVPTGAPSPTGFSVSTQFPAHPNLPAVQDGDVPPVSGIPATACITEKLHQARHHHHHHHHYHQPSPLSSPHPLRQHALATQSNPTSPNSPTSPTSFVHGRGRRPGDRSREMSVVTSTAVVENFSRPRKPSVRQLGQDAFGPKIRTADLPQPEPVFEAGSQSAYSTRNNSPARNQWPRPRERGHSVSSNVSASPSPYSSLQLHSRPSHDQLPTLMSTASRPPTASATHSTASSLTRPPLAFSRVDSMHTQANNREQLPWVVSDEMRSSFRSQLSSSSVHRTSGTERSSVLTKASSVTTASFSNIGLGAGVNTDDTLSVDDVMGMYEQGFADSGMEDNDGASSTCGRGRGRSRSTRSRGDSAERSIRIDEEQASPPGSRGASRSPTAQSEIEMDRHSRMILDAISHPLLPATREREEPPEVRGAPDSLATSPDEYNDGLPTAEAAEKGESDEDSKKHDSAKLLEPDDPSLRHSGVSVGSQLSNASSAHQPAPPEDPGARDRYGFKKQTHNITRAQYDAWDGTYSEYLARRRRKWVAFLKDEKLMTDHPIRFPQRSAKAKRFVRKGIPPDWRGAAWFYYAGGPAILAKHGGVYDQLLAESGGHLRDIDREIIERDLYRTFPDNVRFRPPQGEATSPPSPAEANTPVTVPPPTQDAEHARGEPEEEPEPEIIASLRRVLHAFAIYNPRIGYCQSLNFLAGMLLLFLESEEQAFWLLNVITRVYLPGTHDDSLEGSRVDLAVLMAELKDSIPGVYDKIAGELEGEPTGQAAARPVGRSAVRKARKLAAAAAAAAASQERLPPITLCMTAWFMSCFIGTLPTETTLRVWDVFFYEGSKTLFRIALAIFKVGEAEIKAVSDPMEMFSVVQTMPRRMLDANALMEACFKRRNGFGHLSQETIETRRKERRERVREQSRPGTAIGDAATDADPEVRRKGTLFNRRNRSRARAADAV